MFQVLTFILFLYNFIQLNHCRGYYAEFLTADTLKSSSLYVQHYPNFLKKYSKFNSIRIMDLNSLIGPILALDLHPKSTPPIVPTSTSDQVNAIVILNSMVKPEGLNTKFSVTLDDNSYSDIPDFFQYVFFTYSDFVSKLQSVNIDKPESLRVYEIYVICTDQMINIEEFENLLKSKFKDQYLLLVNNFKKPKDYDEIKSVSKENFSSDTAFCYPCLYKSTDSDKQNSEFYRNCTNLKIQLESNKISKLRKLICHDKSIVYYPRTLDSNDFSSISESNSQTYSINLKTYFEYNGGYVSKIMLLSGSFYVLFFLLLFAMIGLFKISSTKDCLLYRRPTREKPKID